MGCDRPPETPEARIRALFSEVERASRERDLGTLRDMISETYSDTRGRNQEDVRAILTAYYLRRGSIYVLTRVRTLELQENGRARASVLAGLARAPTLDFGDLRRPQADVYVFDLDLAEEEDTRWRVTAASWRQALWDPAAGGRGHPPPLRPRAFAARAAFAALARLPSLVGSCRFSTESELGDGPAPAGLARSLLPCEAREVHSAA